MSWLIAWLAVAAAHLMFLVCLALVAFFSGKWEVGDSPHWRDRVAHALSLVIDFTGRALMWPVVLLRLLVKLPSFDVEKFQQLVEESRDKKIRTGTFLIPPQDERSVAQSDDLDRRIRAELEASLGSSHLVKFYPLLRHAWLEFSVGLPKESPYAVGEAEVGMYFLQFAQCFIKGELK